MPKSKEALIPIDENMTLNSIMTDNTTMDNLYQNLAETIKGEKKTRKVKAKAPVKVPAQVKAPIPAQVKAPSTENKEKIILKIQKYQSSKRFGSYITKELKINQSREQLAKLSVERLNNILVRIRLNLNSRNLDSIFENLAITSAKGYETVVSHFGYNINGFTELLMANPGFWDAFERWKIEREMPDIPPGIQLAYIITSTSVAAYNINQMNNMQIHVKNDEIKEKTDKKENSDNKKSTFKLGADLKI